MIKFHENKITKPWIGKDFRIGLLILLIGNAYEYVVLDRLFLCFSFKFAICFNFCDSLQLFSFCCWFSHFSHSISFQFLLFNLNRVKPTVMPPWITPICRGTMVTWNSSVNSVNTSFDSVAPDLQGWRQWIMIWHNLFRSILQNSSVIFSDSFRLF